jgi:GT2 family glycosyltransferase
MPSDSSAPSASIVVPTRARPDYLEVALASIAPQARSAGAELIVVDDAGSSEPTRLLCERFGVRYEPHPRPLGLNVGRNTGVERSSGELVVFVDDDVEVCDGWFDALLVAARENPDVEVFAGRILPRLEGSPPRGCGREGPPITSLDLGPRDTATRFAWGANMAIRRNALERIGPFDVSLEHGGDEQEWQERLRAADQPHPASDGDEHARGLILYVARATLHHRRTPADARLRCLCRAAYARGRASRRFDAWRGEAPALAQELRTLAGCVGHVVSRRCPAGLVMVAHSAGRVRDARRRVPDARSPGHVREARNRGRMRKARNRGRMREARNREAPQASATDSFLSGESGTIGGVDAVRRRLLDAGLDALQVATGRRASLDRSALRQPPSQRVLVLCVERPARRALVDAIRAELAHSRHTVEFHSRAPEERGKFENLNLLLAAHPTHGHDWLLVLDDDIALPSGFLDRFLFLADRFRLDLAQPAHRLASHAAWQVTRRRPRSTVRETSFVEIGPVTAFRGTTFSTLLPFPELRMGWGLDMHWAAVARANDWRCGVIDATPIAHRASPAASAYSREQALAEARAFLERRPYLSASEAQRTLATHRRW